MSVVSTGFYVPALAIRSGGHDDYAVWSENVWLALGFEKHATRLQCGVTKWLGVDGVTHSRLVAIDFFTGETVIADLDPESGAITKWRARPKVWGGLA